MSSKSSSEDALSDDSVISCDPVMSRKAFVAMVLKRGAIAGAVLAAPAVIDKFLVAPACAAMTSATGGETAPMNSMEP